MFKKKKPADSAGVIIAAMVFEPVVPEKKKPGCFSMLVAGLVCLVALMLVLINITPTTSVKKETDLPAVGVANPEPTIQPISPPPREAATPTTEPSAKTKESVAPPPPLRQGFAPGSGENIPGVMPVDVYGNLVPLGFTRTGPDEWMGSYLTNCERREAHQMVRVEVTGPTVTSIRQVRVQGVSFTKEPKRTVGELAYIASLPYEGSRPADAKAWVEKHIGENARVVIGGVSLELIVNNEQTVELVMKAAKAGEADSTTKEPEVTKDVDPLTAADERADEEEEDKQKRKERDKKKPGKALDPADRKASVAEALMDSNPARAKEMAEEALELAEPGSDAERKAKAVLKRLGG